MKRHSLYFTAPGQVAILEETLPSLPPDRVRVQTLLSAISPGTELLIYRGLFPPNLPLDENLPGLSGEFKYPLKYGYAAVGKVIDVGSSVDPAWEGRQIFAFHPHESLFDASPGDLMPLPGDITLEQAVFLPNMETAVNFVMDGAPLVGERVVVFGQGIVGLLTAALLAQFPLASLLTLDSYPLRRQASLQAGAHHSLDPTSPDLAGQLSTMLPEGADLVYELSGNPAALDQAIALTGFAGRLVIGSWYGQKRASLDLGGRFHRSRIHLISSQVSTLAPELSGRWTKARRLEVAWDMLSRIAPARFITQRFPLRQASQAYTLIDRQPAETIQVLFTYE